MNRFLDPADHAVLSDAGKGDRRDRQGEKSLIVQDQPFESAFDRVVAETKQAQRPVTKNAPHKGKKS